MNRSFWLILLLFFSATAVGAGWFAVNAPEASRPNFADLGAVRLAAEKPPLPPAQLARPASKGFENVLRRPLFSAGEGGGSRKPVGAPVAAGAKMVAFRSLMSPFSAAPGADFIAFKTPRAPRDDFQAAFGVTRPQHEQYVGAHLIPKESLSPDGAPPAVSASRSSAAAAAAAATPGVPTSAPIIRPRPKQRGGGSVSNASGSAAVASAATRSDIDAASSADSAAAERDLRPEEEIILLGVLLRRGKTDRALIRLASGESRRVTLGDEVAGWRVSAIGADSIKLQRASATREIKVPD